MTGVGRRAGGTCHGRSTAGGTDPLLRGAPELGVDSAYLFGSNALIHGYVTLDYAKVVEALERLDAIEEFAEAVREVEATAPE